MRLSERLTIRRNRKQALINIADYYLAEQQRQQYTQQNIPQPYSVFAPGARYAPGDPVTNTFDPMSQTPPLHDPDPKMTESVNQLAKELDQEVTLQNPQSLVTPTPRLKRRDYIDAIKRRTGEA